MVKRARLVERLDAGIERPLTLVSAPAGSGKTVLLDEWRLEARSPGPVASLVLDREHRDRCAFWTDVVGAAGAAVPELRTLAVPPRSPLEGFLGSFARAVSTLDSPLVLLLDDLHVVRSPEVAGDLDWLLERTAARLRLVLSTRSDPPLRFERLRLAGRMAELRASDLAFTLREAEALLGDLDLSPADVEVLWRRTEGWVGGLRLAQMSLEDADDRAGFVRGFAGNDRAVSDYLMTEVVARQPSENLDFLLRTCLVDRISGELADALTLGQAGDEPLRRLERGHGLATTEDGHWYRYHPLLVPVLRAESRRRLPEEQRALHGRAGRWHAEHGDPLEAVRHALEAHDWELGGEVLRERWLAFVANGRGTTLRELGQRMPAEVVRGDAELALALAGLELEAGDHAAADELLVEAHALAGRLPKERARRFAVTSTATDLYRARLRGNVTEALSAARVVLEERWQRGLAADVRALTLANLGIAEFWAGDLEPAADRLREAAGLGIECANDYVLFLAEAYGGAVDVAAGRLGEAQSRARTALQLADRRGWTSVAHAAIGYATLATVHIWRNELGELAPLAERASAALTGSSEPLLGPGVALLRAQVVALGGDPLTGLDLVRGATVQGPLPDVLRAPAGMLEAELWLALAEPVRARGPLVALHEESPDAAIGLARIALAEGHPGRALREVVGFLGDERPPALPFSHVEARVVDAVARDALRDEAGATRALEHALDLAEPRGCPGAILRYGPPLRPLLRRLLASGTRHQALAASLLGVLERSSRPAPAAARPLLEPLSERELTVLRFLPTMMSNAEIAARMYVSVNTVKTHLKHVYRKLDVADRRSCVERGRELRLLSPGVGER
jgi:LuxR family transcriptional regulator, maltose regulon positive regulatory protein